MCNCNIFFWDIQWKTYCIITNLKYQQTRHENLVKQHFLIPLIAQNIKEVQVASLFCELVRVRPEIGLIVYNNHS